MATLHFLGTGAALSEPHRTTTMLGIASEEVFWLIDCGGDVLQRAMAAGLHPDRFAGLILTHEHPDHVSGFPLFIEKMWLAGRHAPLPVYGPREALEQARRCFATFDTHSWTGLPALLWHVIPPEEHTLFYEDARWRMWASPGVHGVPTLGIRIEDRTTGRSMTYSSDTEPCASIARLAHGSTLLVHEATGKGPGHSSAEEAAHIAQEAGVHRLFLVHLPATFPRDDIERARRIFPHTHPAEELGKDSF